jgi:hypothetical protein
MPLVAVESFVFDTLTFWRDLHLSFSTLSLKFVVK